MSFHEQLQLATGVDSTLIGVGLFVAVVFVLWALTHLIDRPDADGPLALVAPMPHDNESVV